MKWGLKVYWGQQMVW